MKKYKLYNPTSETQHTMTDYDTYVRQAVQAALDDPSPGIPDDVVEREFALKRAALLSRSLPNNLPIKK